MVEEASLEFRLGKTDETGDYLLEKIKHIYWVKIIKDM